MNATTGNVSAPGMGGKDGGRKDDGDDGKKRAANMDGALRLLAGFRQQAQVVTDFIAHNHQRVINVYASQVHQYNRNPLMGSVVYHLLQALHVQLENVWKETMITGAVVLPGATAPGGEGLIAFAHEPRPRLSI
jgi:hypothetical protein